MSYNDHLGSPFGGGGVKMENGNGLGGFGNNLGMVQANNGRAGVRNNKINVTNL